MLRRVNYDLYYKDYLLFVDFFSGRGQKATRGYVDKRNCGLAPEIKSFLFLQHQCSFLQLRCVSPFLVPLGMWGTQLTFLLENCSV